MLRVVQTYRKSKGHPYNFVVRVRSDAVLTACPDLENLNQSLIWVPEWNSGLALITNHVIIMPSDCAVSIMSVFLNFEDFYLVYIL